MSNFVHTYSKSIPAGAVYLSAQINAFLIGAGSKIELPDVLIAATFLAEDAALVLTFNSDHFARIPILAGKVVKPAEAVARLAQDTATS